jgi:hypothetical protein
MHDLGAAAVDDDARLFLYLIDLGLAVGLGERADAGDLFSGPHLYGLILLRSALL